MRTSFVEKHRISAEPCGRKRYSRDRRILGLSWAWKPTILLVVNTGRTQYLSPEWLLATHVFAALGEPVRQKIIMLFEPGEELAIKDIAARFDLGRTTVVHHLAVLHAVGILNMRRKGRETLYSVAYDAVLEAIRKMQLLMEEKLWAELGAKARIESKLTVDARTGQAGGPPPDIGDLFAGGAGNDEFDLDMVEEVPLLFVSDDDAGNGK